MQGFADWVAEITPPDHRPVFTAFNAPFDWMVVNEYFHRYLGYNPLPGAQMRFLVFGRSHLIAALGFGASAWKVAARDRWIGWTAEERTKNLHLIVNNARFLIMPWITSKNLASRILGGVTRVLPELWEKRYAWMEKLLSRKASQTPPAPPAPRG